MVLRFHWVDQGCFVFASIPQGEPRRCPNIFSDLFLRRTPVSRPRLPFYPYPTRQRNPVTNTPSNHMLLSKRSNSRRRQQCACLTGALAHWLTHEIDLGLKVKLFEKFSQLILLHQSTRAAGHRSEYRAKACLLPLVFFMLQNVGVDTPPKVSLLQAVGFSLGSTELDRTELSCFEQRQSDRPKQPAQGMHDGVCHLLSEPLLDWRRRRTTHRTRSQPPQRHTHPRRST